LGGLLVNFLKDKKMKDKIEKLLKKVKDDKTHYVKKAIERLDDL
jgi:Txe/YoeB family toxin of Txe-Axe toxin-antitoxin module